MLQRTHRQLLGGKKTPAERFINLHAAAWGSGKMGKSHLGLDARTHEVRLPGKAAKDDFSDDEPGDVIIPSKPLLIAYANFDRDPHSVVMNLPDDAQIIHEKFYEDEEGELLIAMTDRERERLFTRYEEFLDEATEAEVNMIVTDGGKTLWDEVREARLPDPAGKDPEGNPRHLPRQYGPANREMRARFMRRLYSAPTHTLIVLEARELWSGQNDTKKDANGNVVLDFDGWSKTDHMVDTMVHMRMASRNINGAAFKQREGLLTVALKDSQVGQSIVKPTFRDLYKRNVPSAPLLLPEDRAEFLKLEAKHGSLVW